MVTPDPITPLGSSASPTLLIVKNTFVRLATVIAPPNSFFVVPEIQIGLALIRPIDDQFFRFTFVD